MTRPIKALIGLLLTVLSLSNGSAADNLEYAIKATYLTKFAPFVQWPPQAFPPGAPFVICAQGTDAVTALIDRVSMGQFVNGRPVVVRHLEIIDRGAGCHIAYLAGSERQPAGVAAAMLRGTPVLTVAEAQRGRAIVNFVIDNNRVRFDIDEQAAADSGLLVSSKLLGLARFVNRRR